MVESLSELNKIVQKPNYQTVGNWMVRKILRPAALPLTWLLLHTPITANQVTLFSIALGLFANFLLAQAGTINFLAGAFILQLWYLLDHVDGQIARYRKTASLTGRFYDFLMHHIIHPTMILGIGWYAWSQSQSNLLLLVVFISTFCLFLFNSLYDIQYKAYYERLLQFRTIEKRLQSSENQSRTTASDQEKNRIKLAVQFIHKSIEGHVVLNVLTFGALLNHFWINDLDFRTVIFGYYSLAIPTILILKVTHAILTNKVDSQFDATFAPRDGNENS